MLRIVSVLVAIILPALVSSALCEVDRVSRAERTDWVRHTIPLPKSVRIDRKARVAIGSVEIIAPAGEELVLRQAVIELTELLGPRTGPTQFTIEMTLGGPDSRSLAKLPNSGQAYRVFPVGEDRLKLVALTPRGLYYAAKTVQQLLKPRIEGRTACIPLVTITDWPDMEDRGVWGADCFAHLRWMGDRKLNLAEQITDHGVDSNGAPFASLRPAQRPLVEEGPLYGIEPIPVVLHLEQSSKNGAIQAYPYIKGRSEVEGAMCYSQPKTVRIIAEWIEQLAGLPNVDEVDVWMSENLHGKTGCQCDLCVRTGVDPMVLEARAVVKAWRMVQKRTGRDIGIRLLTSEATEEFNGQIIAELPREVKLVYYHSLLTYTCWHAPQLRPYLADFAAGGGWLSVCPNLGSLPGFWMPFNSVGFIRYRMEEYLSKGVRGLLGYPVPRMHYTYFNTEAAAEYTWNLRGRSEREFAVSHAVREGIRDPEKFADYVLAVGRVEWDCYGSDWPSRAQNWIEDPIDVRLVKGTVPDIGYVKWDFITVPFGSIRTLRQLNEDVELAARAVRLADELGIETYRHEARVARGLIGSLKALYELKQLVRDGRIEARDKARAQEQFQAYVDSLRQVVESLPEWEDPLRRASEPFFFTDKTCKVINQELIDRMVATAAEMGVTVK